MKLPWLHRDAPFPPVHNALDDPDGLLAAGGDLSLARLRAAYSSGIFPWYSEGEPILWWSPDPRMVLDCRDFAPSHSLRKLLRRIAREAEDGAASVEVRVDTACGQVMQACAAPREGRPGTWITADVQRAYLAWHRAGQVHSVETWMDGELAGGLYGVNLGAMFFGESMFSRRTDASKIALAYLVRFLLRHGVDRIDCQQQTGHLASLGARPVPRAEFVAAVQARVGLPGPRWQAGRLDAEGVLHPIPPQPTS